MHKYIFSTLAGVMICMLLIVGCKGSQSDFVIISGSENESLEPLLKAFGSRNRVNVVMKYKGSIDMMMEL